MVTELNPADTDAYVKARRQRSMIIGLALGAFVVLVFAITLAKMDASHKALVKAKAAASASAASAQGAHP